MGRSTYYTYTNHLLTQIGNNLHEPLEITDYEDEYLPSSRVISQTLQDKRRLELSYLWNSTTITTTGIDGRSEVAIDHYAGSNTITATVVNGITVNERLSDN
jgi:hypothetical protein